MWNESEVVDKGVKKHSSKEERILCFTTSSLSQNSQWSVLKSCTNMQHQSIWASSICIIIHVYVALTIIKENGDMNLKIRGQRWEGWRDKTQNGLEEEKKKRKMIPYF